RPRPEGQGHLRLPIAMHIQSNDGDGSTPPPSSGPRFSIMIPPQPVPAGLEEEITQVGMDAPDPELERDTSPDLEISALHGKQLGHYGNATIHVDRDAGWAAVQRIRQRMESFGPALRETLGPRLQQPWFIAGVSDGMGLYSTVALMEAGAQRLVGIFYEPEA